MQLSVIVGDRQSQPGAPGGARPSRICTPEAGEDEGGLAWAQPHSRVTDSNGHSALVDAELNRDRAPLAVLDGVDHQVAQDPLDPPRVNLGNTRAIGRDDLEATPPPLGQRGGRVDGAPQRGAQIRGLDIERRRAGVEAADLQKVCQQGLETVNLVVQKLC